MKWFDRGWYAYLFSDLKSFDNKIEVIFCRMKGHPSGPIWYNPGGLEPNLSCKDCGDDC